MGDLINAKVKETSVRSQSNMNASNDKKLFKWIESKRNNFNQLFAQSVVNGAFDWSNILVKNVVRYTRLFITLQLPGTCSTS